MVNTLMIEVLKRLNLRPWQCLDMDAGNMAHGSLDLQLNRIGQHISQVGAAKT